MQFKRAIHIATWLCGAIIRGVSGEIVNTMDVHQDTPIMCAKQLLRAAQVRVHAYASACKYISLWVSFSIDNVHIRTVFMIFTYPILL